MVQRIDVPVNKTHKLEEPAPTSTSATHMPTHVDTDPHNGLKKKFGKMLWVHNLDLFSISQTSEHERIDTLSYNLIAKTVTQTCPQCKERTERFYCVLEENISDSKKVN